ncbi:MULTISPECIES: hypothetical protein [Psychrilyobacter]|uniref:Uncharacterized protein n=1 Tax=Psychrilyobacter piezotolerans TaxID=2293438 RepID=A0ABX9KGL3_9FUSO|nr:MULTISPECIES: hypothetical protein [Psychrilyobacter]MCS5422389.1 hypothetical protein [Psychrilyobacter sp. S5]NDI78405.1 hypothetical protein [Psychrilyobacter piezotolerans]RDE61130.1 hypothetical protein DV867_09830 [Psychrilyobacter sp. S5]REI40771.1 hypothetical protein DYH56_09830 [Psychrilyobacter piezotolerans]
MNKKILITLRNIDEYICGSDFYVSKNMILSPIVKDCLKERDIKLSYSEAKENKEISLENRIKIILEKEFNVVEKEKVNKIIKIIEEMVKNGN